MPIESVLFFTRIRNALRAADLKTVGEMRETSDETLISLPDFARGSLSDLRMKLGLPSTDGVSRSACRAGLEHNRAECGAHLIVFEPMGDIQCCRIWDSAVRDLSARQRGSE
jgi:Bacterial RNA polymerase, alpha chain C terminal domain